MGEITHKKGKIYYSMGEVSEMFDVNPSLIRFWEKKFDVLKPHKNKKGNRMFTPQDVDNLKLIYHLVKERGMTLAGAEKRLKENKEGTMRDMDIADRLLSIRAMLVEIREELKKDGEIISSDGYLDENFADDATDAIAETFIEQQRDEQLSTEVATTPVADANEPIVLTDEVRIEMVTDGSSPWHEPEPEEKADTLQEPGIGEGFEDRDEPVDNEEIDPLQREAALKELSGIKDILDSWNDTVGNTIESNSTDENIIDPAAGNAIGNEPVSAHAESLSAWSIDSVDDSQTSVTTASADNYDATLSTPQEDTSEYSDPWEELEDRDIIFDQPEPAMTPAIARDNSESGTGEHTDSIASEFSDEQEIVKPTKEFGTDACSTFSPDDIEAMKEAAAEQGTATGNEVKPEEEPKRPGIYEQTLF